MPKQKSEKSFKVQTILRDVVALMHKQVLQKSDGKGLFTNPLSKIDL